MDDSVFMLGTSVRCLPDTSEESGLTIDNYRGLQSITIDFLYNRII